MPYIMRPEFLLNFLTLVPKASEDAAAQQLLPSTGLQIGHLPMHMQRIWKRSITEGPFAGAIEVKISDAISR
jgi:hypothetical protein